MLSAISARIVTGHQDLQNQLLRSDMKLENELQHVRYENDRFREELRREFGTTVVQSSIPVSPVVSSSVSNPTYSVVATSSSGPSSVSTSDFQTQILSVLNSTFSKLSSIISDTYSVLHDTRQALSDSKSSDSKVKWIKFSGDPKKFRSWYLAIMAQLSIAPWSELYDVTLNSVVLTTTNTSLNGKLYAKVIGALEGSALQHMLSRAHLQANGILFLHELHQMYKPKNVPEVIAAKTVEFWGSTKRQSHESVDDYYNRFQELLEELSEADEPISKKSAIHHFIFTLGAEFEPLQNNFCLGSISAEWQTQDWPTLLVLCRDFYNSVNPKGPTPIRDRDPFAELHMDRNAHHKKIHNGFMNPTRFCQEIKAEQLKFPGKCIYHLSSTHPTDSCNIKKEYEKILQSKKSSPTGTSSGSTGTTSGQLRHLTEDVFEDAVDADDTADAIELGNDTNESDLLYFAHVSNHYLRLVKSDTSTNSELSRHPTKFPIIIDSGANFHMFKERGFFKFLTPATGKIILGDGKTSIPILGVGTVECLIGNNSLVIENVRYAPALSVSVYSLFVHTQLPGHGVYSSFEEGLFLTFPSFKTKAIIGDNDIYLDALPLSMSTMIDCQVPFQDEQHRTACRNMKQFQENILQEQEHLDNILHHLQLYYQSVTTKCRLNLEVPAGFRRSSVHTQNMQHYYSLRHNTESSTNI